QGTDAIDSCVASAASGYSDILKDELGHVDSQAISRALTESKDSLLALGTAYQQAHPEHYFHYYAHDEVIKDRIKAFILEKINNHNLGYDYYQIHNFPCQHALVAEIIRELIETNRLEDIESNKRLVTWLIHQGCTEPLAALFNRHPDLMNLPYSTYPYSTYNEAFPLILAAIAGHREIVELLLERGADVHVKDNNGSTALMWAAGSGNQNMVKLLLERGADIHAKNNNGWTALMLAAGSGNQNIVELLLERGADVDVKNNEGSTALMWVAGSGNQNMVKLLLERRADVDVKNDDGKTALMWAAERGHRYTVKLLLERGADVDVKGEFSNTALMLAAERGHRDTV
ncbi:ankyrin repeat domain-containing protein, partial [bacterium]|nr:ankyrin repeat domain-containing protein [bacterium]